MKKVFLVEDHHCVLDAQQLLVGKMLKLCELPNNVVCVEGCLTESIPAIDDGICAMLLQKGEISGGEFVLQKLSIQGTRIAQLDDPDLYQRNLDALDRVFASLEKNNVMVQDFRILAKGIDHRGFPAEIERANLAFNFQSQGAPVTFHAETWVLFVYIFLNLAIDWGQWQIAERVLPQDEWRKSFSDHLPDHMRASSLFDCIDAAINFYRLNVERDTVYADNIDDALKTCDSLVFALGPFHHYNLSELLRKRGIEVNSVKIPCDTQESDLMKYRRQIMRK